LNIALELLFEPTVIVCDEPTSGLSFNDTEQIVDILNTLSDQGKIVIITIHQPTSTIFKKFDKVLLMDMNGKQVYYGTPDQCFDYFDDELAQLTYRKMDVLKKKEARTSDYMYEVISYPEYNDLHELLFEQSNKMLQIKRKFPPEYWRDKFKRKMLYEIIQQESTADPNPVKPIRGNINMDLQAHIVSLYSYIQRSLTMKMRNKTNTIITFIEAPLLALIVSFILRLAEEGKGYSFSTNSNIGIYVFVSLIAFIFLGLSNSIEEIYDERKIILREKMMNLKISYYLISKFVALAVFSIIQVILYTSVSSMVLGMRGVFTNSIAYFFMASMIGFSIGLLASSFIKDNKTIVNLLPLILIPQIIFGGAVIEYERMNKSITLIKTNPIPEIVQIIPSRWLFEGLATSYAKNTVFHRKLYALEKKKLTYIDKLKHNTITHAEFSVLLSTINRDKEHVVSKWDPNVISNEYLNSAVSVMDGRYLNYGKNVFLSSYKQYGSHIYRTWNFNMLILLMYLVVFNIITMIKLKYLFKE